MFGFGKNKDKVVEKDSTLHQGMKKTRRSLFGGLFSKKQIDEDVFELLETRLIQADMGLDVVNILLENVRATLKRKALSDKDALVEALKTQMHALLKPIESPLQIPEGKGPFVLLVVGVNGAGKTTTIGKMAKQFQNQGLSVMLAAGDTFRAAAVEQLQAWGERNAVPVITQGAGADSASVIFDAVASAKAKQVDVLIADTAGRLHTQDHLMAELGKINRVLKKHGDVFPQETLLVLDASIGQNALNQAQEFHKLLSLTGLAITKMDGTAKGGILFAMAKTLRLPIRFIGVGEGIEDLRVFAANEFVSALLDEN